MGFPISSKVRQNVIDCFRTYVLFLAHEVCVGERAMELEKSGEFDESDEIELDLPPEYCH